MWRFLGVTFYILSCDSMGSNSGYLHALVARVFAPEPPSQTLAWKCLWIFFFLICFFCSCLVLFVCFSFYIHLFIWVYICVGVSVDVRGLLIGIIGSFLLCGFQEPNSGQKARWKHIESRAILLALRCFFVPLISAVNYFSWVTNNHSWTMSHQDLSCNKGSFNPTFSVPFQIFLFFSKSFSVLQLPYL